MTKSFSDIINFVATCVFFVTILICSGTGHASPSNSIAVTSAESQVEIVELSAWPRIRDSLLGRERRYDPPPPHPHRDFHTRRPHDRHRFNPPPPHRHHHIPHHRR